MYWQNLRAFAAFSVAGIVSLGVFARPASAQDRPAPVVELAAGALLFPDDGITVRESLVGGAARFYLLPRISVGPEIAYIRGRTHSHLMLTGNITFDVVRSVNGQPPRVTPFVLAGGGLYRTRESFSGRDFRSSEGAFTAGGGIRAHLGHRVTAGVEARIGWELHLRVNAMLGFRLGGV